ncbi:MAG TPA: rhodanese-like domain-containing protein [Steroidobacteraceae bacterium]|nr:rhodanese-like domain-containing protein [Steroidobacteraceae bacterium]
MSANRDLPRAGALILILLGVSGLAAEPPSSAAPADEPADFWTGPINGPVPATVSGGAVIHAQELSELLKQGGVVLVDVSNLPHRPENLAPGAPWLPVPHRVIPGSVWVPGAGIGAIAPDIDVYFRDQLAQATRNDPDHPIVIYCHERCWLSWNGAKRAVRYGYRNVHWFPEGIEGWRAAGLDTVIAEPSTPSSGTPTP